MRPKCDRELATIPIPPVSQAASSNSVATVNSTTKIVDVNVDGFTGLAGQNAGTASAASVNYTG